MRLWKISLFLAVFGFTAFGVTGKSRVIGACQNLKDPKFKTDFELDTDNNPSNQDGLLGYTGKVKAARGLWIKGEIWGAHKFTEVASSINFRLELATAEFVSKEDSILSTYRSVDHQHFSFTKSQSEQGTEWKATFKGPDYEIACDGMALFAPQGLWINLADSKLDVLTDWKTHRMDFHASYLQGGKEFCGVRIISNDPSIERQKEVLNWIWITSGTDGHAFYTKLGRLFPIRENVRAGNGRPALRLQSQGVGMYINWETNSTNGSTKPSLEEVLARNGYSVADFEQLQADAIACDPE